VIALLNVERRTTYGSSRAIRDISDYRFSSSP
jgi:hypothetical protein